MMIVDAADECSNRETLLDILEDIHQLKLNSVHLLIISRRETDIEDSLNIMSSSQISLGEIDVNSDIHAFIHEQVYSDRSKLSKWPEDFRKEITTRLICGADGMYVRLKM